MTQQFGGLKFLLADRHELVVGATEQEAEKIANVWLQAKTTGKHIPIRGTGQVNGERWDWWVWTGDVVAVHTFWVFDQGQSGITAPWGGRGSGLNR